MKHFMGEVGFDSEDRAREIAERVGPLVKNLGGSIDVARSFGEAPDFLVIAIPDDLAARPEELVGLEEGIVFKQVHMALFPAQEDHGILE